MGHQEVDNETEGDITGDSDYAILRGLWYMGSTGGLIVAAITVSWGWRGFFIGWAIPAMILGIIFFLVLGKIESAKGNRVKAVVY